MSALAVAGVLTDENGKKYKLSLEEIVAEQPQPDPEPQPEPEPQPVPPATADAWPSADNRPMYSGGVLKWTGPLGGGANNGNPVQQTRSNLRSARDPHTSSNGQVIDGLVIGAPGNGSRIYVDHNNVTIRQCVIYADWYGIQIGTNGSQPHSCTIEDCLIIGAFDHEGTSGVAGMGSKIGGSKVLRCNISGVENGIFQCEPNQEFTDNWIHDLYYKPEISHSDGIQSMGAFKSLLIERNAIYARNNSAVFIKSDSGPFSGLTVNNNILVCANSNGSAVLGIEGNAGVAKLTNNRILETGIGIPCLVVANTGSIVWSGNVNHETGEPISAYNGQTGK